MPVPCFSNRPTPFIVWETVTVPLRSKSNTPLFVMVVVALRLPVAPPFPIRKVVAVVDRRWSGVGVVAVDPVARFVAGEVAFSVRPTEFPVPVPTLSLIASSKHRVSAAHGK